MNSSCELCNWHGNSQFALYLSFVFERVIIYQRNGGCMLDGCLSGKYYREKCLWLCVLKIGKKGVWYNFRMHHFTYITYPCIYHRGANNLFRHLYPSGVMSKIFANWLTYFNSTIRWFVAVVAGHLCVIWYSSVIRHNTEIGSFDLALYAFIRHVLCLG